MNINKLDKSFYQENGHLVEVLDKENGSWDVNKVRGYGIVVVEFNGLTFGIPLRSNIRVQNKYCFLTTGRQGLDYTKAVLIQDNKYIGVTFQIPVNEKILIRQNEYKIKKGFSKYVERYVHYCNTAPGSTVLVKEYKYTTLINYHKELGIVGE